MDRPAWILVFVVFFLAPLAANAQVAPPAPDDGAGDTPPNTDTPAEPPPPAPEPSAEPSEPEPPAEDVVPPPPPPRRERYDGEQRSSGGYAYEDDSYQDDQADDEGDEGGEGGGIPGFSIRIDPFNWLLEGRLGLELEVVAWKFISVELVPVFVANTTPPAFNLSGREDSLSQESNGIGPISGASIGAGFWLSGEPLRGYVLRTVLTNYSYTYKAGDGIGAGVFDQVNHTERRFYVYLGSHSRWGAFTIAGGIGLGYDLNQQQRCFANDDIDQPTSKSAICGNDGELRIALDPIANAQADLNGPFHPIYLAGRFSLGVAFD